MTPRLLPALLILLALSGFLAPAGWCALQEDSGTVGGVAGPLRYARVYVPVDRLPQEQWRDRAVQYLPVDPQEFERLLAIAQKASRPKQMSTAAAVVSADYSARLEGDTLVDGEARLEIVHLADNPVMLPLDPCGLAISEVRWADEPGQAAKVGYGADGKLAVLVEQAGRLQLRWSLRGHRDASGAIRFTWEAPPSPIGSLVLDLPEEVAPVVEHALVVAGGSDGQQARQWRIELGGHHRLGIRLVPTDQPEDAIPPTRVRQLTEYHLSLHGLEVSSRLELDVYGEPLRRLALRLDPSLRLVKARYGETPLRWTVTAPASQGEGSGVILEFPEPVQGRQRVVWLERALAPIQMDCRWRLPRMRPEGVFWEEGEATVSVLSPLRLEELVPREGRQSSKIDPLRTPSLGETVRLRYFTPDAAAEIVLTRPEAPLQLHSATVIELGGGEVRGEVRAELAVAHGKRFQLEAAIARDWTIDTVEADPHDALADWSVENEGTTSWLTIRLAKAISPRRPETPPLRLTIAARRLVSPRGKVLGINELVPLRFPEAAAGRRLVYLRAREPYELKLTGGETLTHVDPQSLDRTASALLGALPRGLLFEHDAGAAGLGVSLETRRPGYSAEIRVEATLGDDSLRESYRLGCVPEAGRRVDRVLVRFSPARPAPVHWTLGSEVEDHWTVRRLPRAGQAASGSLAEVETWEIRLRPPRSVPFEIRATRTTELADRGPISLACLPEASEQRGAVAVCSAGSAAVRIENSRLQPIPAAAVPVDDHRTIRAAFRYDPVGDVAAEAEPALSISRLPAEDAPPSAWVWSCRLESQYERAGTGRHVATYRLETAGAERLRLVLPGEVTRRDVRGVWVNGQQVKCRSAAAEGRHTLEIELPHGSRFPVVSVSFATSGHALGVVASIVPPLPEIDLPVLTRHWTVRLPPGYQADDPDLDRLTKGTSRLSWPQRLFGPLGRGPDRDPFDPLAAHDWRRVFEGEPVRRSAEARAGALVERLGERTAASRSGPGPNPLDWGTLLADESIRRVLAGTVSDRGRLELLVDRPALAQLGVTPRTPVRGAYRHTPGSRGAALLRRAELALLVHPEAVVVTSAPTAVVYHTQLMPVKNQQPTSLESRRIWWIRPGPLFARISRAAAGEADVSWVPVDAWNAQPPDPKMPWTSPQPGVLAAIDSWGWTAYPLELGGRLPARLSLVRRDTLDALRWAAFLLAISLGWWKAIHRPATLTVVLGIFGVAAFLLPEAYAPVASGALLGIIFVLGLRLIRTNSRRSGPVAAPGGGSLAASGGKAAPPVGILLVALGTLLSPCTPGLGGEPRSEPVPAWWPAHGVLIPVDENGQPTGDKYQVPEEFDAQLRRIAAAATEAAQGWLLVSATYRGELVRQPAPERLVLDELTASIDLEVLGPAARVRIPFGQESPNLLPDRALLDGRPIQHELQKNILLVTVSEKGPHRLELALRPTVQAEGRFSGFDLAIPRLAASRLELTLPADAPAVEVRSARGWVRQDREATPPRLEAELGPTDRLSLRWPGGPGASRGVMDVEELLWLKVKPESVVLDTRLLVHVVEGSVSRLRLSADPRLRLRPVEGAEIRTTPGQPATIQLDLSEPISGQAVIEATFLLPEASGIGNLRLPYLEVLDAHRTRRWMAVSIDPSLQAEEQASDQLERVGPPDFVAAWGDTAVQPRSAYNLPPGEPSWSMTTRPSGPETSGQQTVTWSFAGDGADVHFHARLSTAAGYRFQYRLSAPPTLEVTSISVLEADMDRADRWRRAPDGTITVFLKRPLSGEHTLSLRGRLPALAPGKLPLPILRIEGANLESSVIQLFRKPEVQVEVTNTTGLIEAEAVAVDESRAPLGRLVKWFDAHCAGPVEATLVLWPNRPKVHAEQITSLRSDGDLWEATVAFRIHVDRGVLDELRLSVPQNWSGRPEIDPPVSLQEEDVPGGRRLIIRPVSAITDQYRFTVSSPLVLLPGQRVSVPHVVLEGVEVDRHLLVLPRQSGRQPVAWETQGLSKAELPDDFATSPVAPEALVAYQVDDGPFQAVVRPLGGEPRVHLADIRVAWQAHGTFHSVAIFDLEAAALRECSLRLPGGCKLVQVAVDGVPGTPVRGADGRWRIPLGASAFPQRIEVLFRGKVPAPDAMGLVRFDAPLLEGLPPGRTLWTVFGPPTYEPGDAVGLGSLSRQAHELVRIENVEALMERAASVTPLDPEQTDRWYRQWARRWATLSNRTIRQGPLARRAEVAGMSAAELLPLDRLSAPLAARLQTDNLLAEISAETPAATDLAQLWLQTLNQTQPATRCVGGEGSTSITLRYRRVGATGLSRRWAGAAALAGLVLLTVLGIRWGVFFTLLCRWPCLMGVIVGVGWWLWLWPSGLGWGIVLVSFVASLRSGWRRSRQSGSAIVPLTLQG